MHLSVIFVIALGVLNVEGFALRSREEDGVKCFIQIAQEIVGFYFQNEEAGKMVGDEMKECFPEKDQAEACLEAKRAGIAEKYGEEAANGVEEIMKGLAAVGGAVVARCKDSGSEADMASCAGQVLEAIKADAECDAECDDFIDLFGEKAAKCGEKEIKSKKRELNLKRVLSKLDSFKSMRNSKILKK